jgi:hypothetical protein
MNEKLIAEARKAAQHAGMLLSDPPQPSKMMDLLNRLADALSAPVAGEGGEPVALLREFAETYAGMEDGNGDPCPTVAKARAYLAAPSPSREAELALPQNVINLVIAAREVAYTDQPEPGELQALDKAVEAFASRVPWNDQPDDAEVKP